MGTEKATGSLISIFGSERCLTDQITRLRYASNISGTTLLPSCVVYPVSTEEISLLLKIVNSEALKIFVISRGKNYGYGEAHGTAENQVIVDLSRMDKIIEVNETMAYATIQPGVSQNKLYEYLIENSSRLQLDITGAGLDASIVGNVLERGFGHTDYGDRYGRVIRITVVLADGSVVKTGFGDFENADAVNTYRYGFGPLLDGIFTQSNFGIVTEMCFELMPKPEKTCMFIVSAKDPHALGSLVDAVRELKLEGVVNSAVHFANKARAIGKKENRMAGFWNMSGSISGPANLLRARKKIVRTKIKKACSGVSIWFIDQTMMNLAAWLHKTFAFPLYIPLKDAWDLQKGIPTDNPLRVLLDNHKLTSTSLNTADYETCFLWINAVCKADSNSVSKLLDLTSALFRENGYDFPVTFTAINARSLIMITNINYQRNLQETDKALSFSKQCYSVLIKNGFLPYRSGSGMFEKLPVHSPAIQALQHKLKMVFDPDEIIAPGKYNIS